MSSPFITSYMLKLKSELVSKKNIEDSIASNHINLLLILNHKNPFTNLSFLRDTDKIVTFLKSQDEESRKVFLNVIIDTLFCHKDSYLYKKPYNFFVNQDKENVNEYESSEKEDSWIEWSEVKKIYSKMKENVNKYKLIEKLSDGSLECKMQHDEILHFILLSLYYLIEPRGNMDYNDMYVISSDKKELMTKDKNYIILEEKIFVFNVYKASKFYGIQTVVIPEELMENINLYLKFHPLFDISKETKLLINYNGKGFDADNSITRALYKVFGNRKISSAILKHSYNAYNLGGVIAEMESESRKGQTDKKTKEKVKKE